MTKLDFDYVDSANESRAEYRGLIISAVQDSDCENPWKDSDGYAPLLWYSLDGRGVEDESGAYDIASPLASFSDYHLARDWSLLCSAVHAGDAAALEAELKRERKQYGGRLSDYRREALEERLSELKPSGGRAWGAACDYFAALEELWGLAGVAALDFERSGYSQGDSVRGLLVALPAWRKAMGIPAGADMAADLEAQADIFGAWAFGDCFGYVIRLADDDGEPCGATLDSVWGYIGSDFEKSGLAEAAQSSADYIIDSAERKRLDKLKALIRNRVPVAERPALLAEAGKLESA